MKIPEPQVAFDRALHWIINVMIIYMIVVLVIGLCQTVLGISAVIHGGDHALAQTISDILTFLVIIEIFKSFIEYFKAQRFRLHNVLDPAIVFVIREMIVRMYDGHGFENMQVLAFSTLILSIGIVRTLAVRFSPKGA